MKRNTDRNDPNTFVEMIDAANERNMIKSKELRISTDVRCCSVTNHIIKPGEIYLRSETNGGKVTTYSNQSELFAFFIRKHAQRSGVTLESVLDNVCTHGKLNECPTCREVVLGWKGDL